ncbi:MAG: helix-turn-helix transcriptional regulator [Rhizobiaceae bacterium]|nr:helix-turn-helix transcriptional regulator [Rhizobiaceae bacterium]
MLTSAQMKAGRALVDLSQKSLAELTGLSVPTIKRMEGPKGPMASSGTNVQLVINALESAGVEFIPENGGGAGVRLKK